MALVPHPPNGRMDSLRGPRGVLRLGVDDSEDGPVLKEVVAHQYGQSLSPKPEGNQILFPWLLKSCQQATG